MLISISLSPPILQNIRLRISIVSESIVAKTKLKTMETVVSKFLDQFSNSLAFDP